MILQKETQFQMDESPVNMPSPAAFCALDCEGSRFTGNLAIPHEEVSKEANPPSEDENEEKEDHLDKPPVKPRPPPVAGQTAEENHEPRTLLEAVPISCQLLFGGLSRQNWLRMLCFSILKNPLWSVFFQVVNLANSAYIVVSPEIFGTSIDNPEQATLASPEEDSRGVLLLRRSAQAFDLFCVSVLVMEIAVGILALGFVRHK